MSSCLIISGGDFCPFTVPAGAFVIACDRGYAYAQSCGVRPDLVLGDFDSYRGELDPEIPLRKLPVEKDDTDTMSALRFALDRGYREITLVCALGGRLDHLLANLQAAVFAAKQGAAVHILGQDTEIQTLRCGSLRIPRKEGWSLSVFAAEDRCLGVSISGAKYVLKDAPLTNDFPLGVSNEWAAPEAEINVQEGTLLIIQSRIL